MSNEEIGQELERLEREGDAIRENTIQLTWWMRGGITLEQAWQLSDKERRMVNRLIKENLDNSKKVGQLII